MAVRRCGTERPGLWRRIAAGQVRGEGEAPHIRHELSLLYVAVTRARNTLVDLGRRGGESDLGHGESLAGPCLPVGGRRPPSSTAWQRVSTLAEWEAQGDYFAEREYYAAAEECYRNAQAVGQGGQVARAHRLEQEGDHRTAAGLFAGQGRAAQAAANLERAGGASAARRPAVAARG